MKIAKKVVDKYNYQDPYNKQIVYYHLILENIEDLEIYKEHYFPTTAKKNVNAMIGFKSQLKNEGYCRSSLQNYIIHEGESVTVETQLIAMELEYKETPTSLIDFCTISDNLMLRKIQSIEDLMKRNYMIEIHSNGSYCNINDLSIYTELYEVNDNILKTYLLTGKYEIEDMVIKGRSVVIENSNDIDSNFLSKLYLQIDRNSITFLTNFKNRTLNYTDNDFVSLIKNGIDRGLQNICFQTTGQDMHNIKKLKHLLYNIPVKELNIYISSDNSEVFDLFINTDKIVIFKI